MVLKAGVLVLGSGIAGLYTAIKASAFAEVILITKKETAESNTNYAQGGIASVISTDDSYESHINDTILAGAGLCNKERVDILVKEGPGHIQELIELGTQFTMNESLLDLAREGGHSHARIVHSKDLTGKEVERALIHALSTRKNVRIIENHLAIDLITEHNINKLKNEPINSRHCWGAYVLDVKSGDIITVLAKATVLATGGLGQVYLHTTNPAIATGDGYAMGFRAGAHIGNMEFIQFHPTALYDPGSPASKGPAFLISEAVRGFGGILRLKNGERFMARYDSRLELAPRDIVARAIDNELKKHGDDCVFLDVTHFSKEKIQQHFPHIFEKCALKGIDISSVPIPVVPAAHYACGGIIVDEYGLTSLGGLFAAGEASMTGVHGANRLASNSLLEALVFAGRAAEGTRRYLSTFTRFPASVPEWDDSGTLSADEKILISHSNKELKQMMWDYVGIVRSDLRLEYASRRISNLFHEVEEFYKKTKVFSELIELRNLITCAHLIVKSGKMRRENRGLHYSLDFISLPQVAPPVNTVIQNTYQKS